MVLVLPHSLSAYYDNPVDDAEKCLSQRGKEAARLRDRMEGINGGVWPARPSRRPKWSPQHAPPETKSPRLRK